jgi:putative membrane protein
MLALSMKLIATWLLHATALLALAHLFKGIEISSFGSALMAALVIGLFNLIVRPILVVLTLPVTLFSLGLFLFVINALLFWWAADLLDGFYVSGFTSALLGSLVYSACGVVIDSALERLFAS